MVGDLRNIVARMRGGLGNQLFILAFAYWISEQNGKDVLITLDVREYRHFKLRQFELLELIKDDSIRVIDDGLISVWYEVTRKLFHLMQMFIRNGSISLKVLSKIGLYYGRRDGFSISKSYFRNAYVYGYFQDARIALSVRKKMLSLVRFPNVELNNNLPRIAVSVRCGDDYKNLGWPICSGNYYKKGVEYIISKKYQRKKIAVYVFSDEIERAKEMNIFPGAVYIENRSSGEQLALMSECEDFVIANSSFSWWGSFLGAKSDSVIIMPEYWYATGEKTKDTKLIYDNVVVLSDEKGTI